MVTMKDWEKEEDYLEIILKYEDDNNMMMYVTRLKISTTNSIYLPTKTEGIWDFENNLV